MHRAAPATDPLAVLNRLDNEDKHRLLPPTFVYAGVARGVDLIEVLDRAKVKVTESLWTARQPLEDGTTLARFMIRDRARDAIRARRDAPLGFASGVVGEPRIAYTDMIDRVRAIAEKAAGLIDQQSPTST